MQKALLTTLLVVLAPVFCGARQTESGVRQAPTPPIDTAALVALHERIFAASDETVFNVDLWFDVPARLGDIRDFADARGIFRATAVVEYGPDHYQYGQARISVGTLFDQPGSWDRELCRPRMIAPRIPGSTLTSIAPEDWLVYEIHVLGPAAAIRSLIGGDVLPPALILEGREENPQYIDRFFEAIRRQHARKIQVTDDEVVPIECLTHTDRILSPVLTGTPSIQAAVYGDSHDPRFADSFRQHLDQRPPELPVTLQVVFGEPALVEDLAQLVERHEIDGLYAEMSPEDGIGQIINDTPFSIHGGSMSLQIERAHCAQQLGEAAKYGGRWIADNIRITVPAGKAYAIVSDDRLVDARLLNDYKAGMLDLVVAYHQELSNSRLELHPSLGIPPGCEWYMHYPD